MDDDFRDAYFGRGVGSRASRPPDELVRRKARERLGDEGRTKLLPKKVPKTPALAPDGGAQCAVWTKGERLCVRTKGVATVRLVMLDALGRTRGVDDKPLCDDHAKSAAGRNGVKDSRGWVWRTLR